MLNAGLFSPAVIMPEQFADGMRAERPPEHRLLVAILEDAISCFEKHRAATDRQNRRLFSEAADWIMSERYHGPFSFEYVCSILGIDAGGVRSSLRRKHGPCSSEPDFRRINHVTS